MAEREVGLPVGYEREKEMIDKSVGYFRFKLGVNVKAGGESPAGGTYSQEKPGHAPTLKASVEKEVRGFQVEFEAKFRDFKPAAIVEALRGGKKGELAKKVAFEATLRLGHRRLFGVTFAAVAGLDLGWENAATPVVLKGSGVWSPESGRPALKVEVEVELHLGLSARGWAWVGTRVGAQSLVRFCQQEGLAATLDYLVSSGAVAAAGSVVAGVAGTLALSCLADYVTRNARRKGALLALHMGYHAGYIETMFRPRGKVGPYPALPGASPEDRTTYAELYVSGKKDAIQNARAALSRFDFSRNSRWHIDPSEADGDLWALEYGELLRQQYQAQGRDAEAEISALLAGQILRRIA
jgi:hypothetical protein